MTDNNNNEMDVGLSGEVTPTQNNVPDLVNIGSIPSNLMMDYDTTVYEPVTKSQSFIRFQIDNKGILHSNSKLTISMAEGIAEKAFFPIGVGVNSLIERATLKCGGQTLSEIDDWSSWMGYRSMFISGENNKERESITTSRIMDYETYYNSSKSTSATVISNTAGNAVGLDTGMYPIAGGTADDVLLPEYLSASNTPVFQISMSDLFPFLKMNQLPLYMMRDPLFVELTLSSSLLERLSIAGAADQDQVYNIDLNNVHMIIDHIYYPAEQMEAYAQANPQITLSYHDYSLSKQSLDASQALNNIRNIGGAGRIVTKIVTGISDNAKTGNNHVLNSYFAMYPADGLNTIELNVRYNNEFLYPIDLKNPARVYNLVTLAEGMTPFVQRSGYLIERNTIMGLTQHTQIQGTFFYQAHRLTRNERISGRGIDLYTNYNQLGGSTYLQRAYIEYVKIATITNGLVTTYNA